MMKSNNSYRADPASLDPSVPVFTRVTLEAGDDGDSVFDTSGLRLPNGWIVTTKFTPKTGVAPQVPQLSSVYVADQSEAVEQVVSGSGDESGSGGESGGGESGGGVEVGVNV